MSIAIIRMEFGPHSVLDIALDDFIDQQNLFLIKRQFDKSDDQLSQQIISMTENKNSNPARTTWKNKHYTYRGDCDPRRHVSKIKHTMHSNYQKRNH